jgi:type II secretory pathway pseudopilin PulG
VRVRAADESGFGLIELAFAMVMLNIGILALAATFQSGALAIQRSSSVSNGTAVADKAMEAYRGLQNKAIYLNAPAGGGSDVSGLPNGIPNSTSIWYATYYGDAAAYGGAAYYNYTSPSTNSPLWVTQAFTSSATYSPVPTTVTTAVPSGLAIDPTKAVQKVTGPDGQAYPVYSYVTMVKPQNTSSYGYVKLVTIVVRDPVTITKILARQSSLFDPNVAP